MAEPPRVQLLYSSDPKLAVQLGDSLASLLARCRGDDIVTWAHIDHAPESDLVPNFKTLQISEELQEQWTVEEEGCKEVGQARVLIFNEYALGREQTLRAACVAPGLLVTSSSALSLAAQAAVTMLEQQKAWTAPALLQLLFHAACASYQGLAAGIAAEVQALGGLVLVLSASEETDLLLRAANARASLMRLSQAVFRKSRVLQVLIMGCESKRQRKAAQRTRNLLHLLSESVQLSHELLGTLPTTYLGRVSLVEAEASQHTAVATRHVNSLYVMFLPLLVLQGCFTMNVTIPGQFVDNLDWFVGIVLAHVTLLVLVATSLYHLGWF